MGGRAGPGPRRVFDEPEDVEFVRVMKGHTKHITALAVDHGSSQVRACGFEHGLDVLIVHVLLAEWQRLTRSNPPASYVLGQVLMCIPPCFCMDC